MSRQRVIDTIYIRGEEPVKILFDVEHEVFKAKVFGTWFKNKLIADLKKNIVREVNNVISKKYNWVPIIVVSEVFTYSSEPLKSCVGFEIDRFYVAQKGGGRWLKSEWGDEEKRTRTCQEFKDSFKIPSEEINYNREEKIFYMHYDEKKWAGFQKLTDVINELKEKLRELIRTEAGQMIIANAGALIIDWKE
jgi:hypothetical protein